MDNGFSIGDKNRIVKCLGNGIHTDDVDIEQLWFIAADGVDNFFPDMVETSVNEDGPVLIGERRSFEINRRVVDAINLLLFGLHSENAQPVSPPESLSMPAYDEWIDSNEHLIAQYQAMQYTFISPELYDGVQVERDRTSGVFTCTMGGVVYRLVEVGG